MASACIKKQEGVPVVSQSFKMVQTQSASLACRGIGGLIYQTERGHKGLE